MHLALDIARCAGHGAGASGHQNRVDCVNCARRLAPRPAGVSLPFMSPPKEFPCPMKLPAEGVPAFDATQRCDLERIRSGEKFGAGGVPTMCMRCKNPHHACDQLVTRAPHE